MTPSQQSAIFLRLSPVHRPDGGRGTDRRSDRMKTFTCGAVVPRLYGVVLGRDGRGDPRTSRGARARGARHDRGSRGSRSARFGPTSADMTQDVAVQAWGAPSILRMDFQPIVDTARGTVVGYESLARFGGPADAGPIAGSRSPTPRASARNWRRRSWRALEARSALPPNCFLSVNVGPQALLPHRSRTSSPTPVTSAGSSSRSPSRPRWTTTTRFPTRSRRSGRRARCSRSTTPGPGSPRSSTSRCCARIS